MPIYEFRCVKCDHTQEVIVSAGKGADQVEMKCESCSGEVLERVLSRVSYTMGAGKGAPQASVSTKSCGSGNTCGSIDIPGPTR